MQPDSRALENACLLSAVMFPLFYLLRRQIKKEEPEILLPLIWFFLVYPFPTLRLHRNSYPRSLLRTAYELIWGVTSSLFVVAVIQFVSKLLRTQGSLPNS